MTDDSARALLASLSGEEARHVVDVFLKTMELMERDVADFCRQAPPEQWPELVPAARSAIAKLRGTP